MPLSSPFTISQRIVLALKEDLPIQLLHYKRVEGATSAVIELAKNDPDIWVTSRSTLRNQYKEQGVNWLDYDFDLGRTIRGREVKAILADAVPESAVAKLRSIVPNHIKLIILKGIREDQI